MVLAEIETLLSQKVGLDPSTSSKRIARAVASRQAICGLSDPQAYLALVRTSPPELEELMEQLVVPETWFFRDHKPFDYLKEYVTSERFSNRRLQLLSVPCSTGEEPYSMAIALLAAGLSPTRFAINAIDISHQSIARAKRGIYTKNSFRGEEWIDRNRYFQQTADGFELNQSIRSLVNFQQGNALTLLPILSKQYDIIFCRNLLIYLQPEACSQVLQMLDHLLVSGGLLFVGASETSKIDTVQYASVRQSFTFAFRKLETVAQPLSQVRGAGEEKSRRNIKSKSLPLCSVAASAPHPDLQTVKKLADEGQLEKATALCQTYLSHHPTSAAAHIRLGQIYQAVQRDDQAELCFQRALYLEPNSYKALVHLALLKEYQGDQAGAKVIRQRLQRLQHVFESGVQ